MAAPRISVTCVVCGVQVMRRYDKAKRGRCAMCGIRASEANARQIHAQAGPYYERWADGVIKYSKQLAARRRQEVAAARAARRAALHPYPGDTRQRFPC